MTSVSIIIPTYNALDLLKKNIPKVLESMRPHDELIIVDDAGTDGSDTWLTKHFQLHRDGLIQDDVFRFTGIYRDIEIKVLVNQSNQRFASSCNRGVASAKTEIVVLLNNDVTPEPDFLAPLLSHFRDPSVFAVGCKEFAGKMAYGKAIAHFERGFYVHARAPAQESGDTAWVAGGSGAFRTSMWNMLGGFDLKFKPAYGEDIDLSYRARMKGWKTLFEAKSIVHHVHESTNASVFGQQQIEIMSFKNAILFMWKNARGVELVKHFLWLPYHLVFTNIRSKGRFAIGLWKAVQTYV